MVAHFDPVLSPPVLVEENKIISIMQKIYIFIVKCFNAASECSALSVVYNALKIITVCWE